VDYFSIKKWLISILTGQLPRFFTSVAGMDLRFLLFSVFAKEFLAKKR